MLWELWRRLDPASFVVLTTPHPDAGAWDAEQPFRVVRTRQQVLWPTRGLRDQIDRLAREVGATGVVAGSGAAGRACSARTCAAPPTRW